MRIRDFETDEKVMIIAEIGNNHEGNFDLALDMVHAAAECGVDAVKFQTIVPDRLVSSQDSARLEQLGRFQFSYRQFEELAECARSKGILFLTSVFDVESVERLEPFTPAYKIASSDNNFYPLLSAVAKTGKPLILSTGLASMREINESVRYIDDIWRRDSTKQSLAVLHCVSCYPVEDKDANILSVKYLKDHLPTSVTVGYSDHTLRTDASVLAVAVGARIIEKHFTLDKNYSDFRDHKLSADPNEMTKLVREIRNTETLMGCYRKEPSASELQVKSALRRSIAAAADLEGGHVLTCDDLTWVRPGTGFAVGMEDEFIGKTLKKNIKRGIPFTTEHVD